MKVHAKINGKRPQQVVVHVGSGRLAAPLSANYSHLVTVGETRAKAMLKTPGTKGQNADEGQRK